MLIPRFSIRLMLGLTTGCAFVFLAMSIAARGNTVAMGIVISILTLAIAFAAYSVTFLTAYAFAHLSRVARPEPKPESPFATETLPPQVVPPQNPE